MTHYLHDTVTMIDSEYIERSVISCRLMSISFHIFFYVLKRKLLHTQD